MRIDLPWPDKRLNPHAKGHWRPKAAATKDARGEGFWRTVEALGGLPAAGRGREGLVVRFTYHPPDKRRRDAQNMPAMLKAYIDGIADALGVDDSTFECVFPSKFAEPVKGGKIVVEIE